MMQTQPPSTFRWRGKLGISAMLFLLFGVLNVFLGVVVPVVQHLGQSSILVLNPQADTIVFGRPPSELLQTYEFLDTYRVIQADWKYANVMAVGICQIALAWFGLRHRQLWTLWTLAVADLVMIPYWILIFQAYVSRGVPLSPSLVGVPLFFYPATIVPVATVLGWLGFRET